MRKCDGQCPCTRCNQQGVCCQYESNHSASKAALRAEIRGLRKTISALVRPEAEAAAEAGAQSEESKVAFTRPKCNLLPVTATFSNGSEPSPDEHKPNNDNESSHAAAEAPSLENAMGENSQASGSKPCPGDEMAHPCASSETWTCVTDDLESTYHLIALYFCWEYPSFAPINKEDFLRDFLARKGRFCSSLLVNALLSLGCQLSDRGRCCRAGPGKSHIDGDEFFEEAQRLLASAQDHSALTTIQALVIMSLRQARSGRVLESKHYAEQAMLLTAEAGLHVAFDEHHADRDALAKTFWGTFMLHQ